MDEIIDLSMGKRKQEKNGFFAEPAFAKTLKVQLCSRNSHGGLNWEITVGGRSIQILIHRHVMPGVFARV